MIATLELVELRRGGGVLTAAVTAGATVLPLDLTLDYDEAGGLLELGGEVYTYTAVGDDFVTLASGVLADAEVDTPAWTVDAQGNREETWKAWVDLGDDGDTVPASIPTSLIGYFPEGDAATGQDVEVEATADGYRVANRPDQVATFDGSLIDPATPIPGGQTFSLDAPSDTTGYPEDYGWWQVDADDKVLGFWRLVGGVWTPQEFDIEGALFATNAFIEYLNGKVITGTTVQTRAATDRGIKLGEVSGATNYDEAFIVFNESGVPFLKAVPAEELAVIAGEVKMTTGTVSDGASLGGVTEITRATDGTAGAVRLTGYTTAPKSAPTVTTGYDTVQFTDDGLWGNRHGWATDGTYWYTARMAGVSLYVEKWTTAGTLNATSGLFGADDCAGVAVIGSVVWVLYRDLGSWAVRARNTSNLSPAAGTAAWTQDDGNSTPAIGADSATGELLIAQSRPSDVTVPNRVRIRRYTTGTDPLTAGASVDTAFGYGNDLSGVLYGSFDLGANRYIFTTPGNNTYRVVDTTGAAVSAEDWQAGMNGKVGFTYTGGAFVSMDSTGLMRTYTGQDKATAIGDASLTKWVGNTLANVTYETDRSPRAKITIPKRTKLNVTTSAINTGGANSPDRVKVYVGQGATNPARTAMWKQAGLLSGTILPNLATNPSFESGATGWAAVSGSTAPAASTDQSWVGAQSLKTQRGAGTAIQIASRTITTLLTSGAGQYSYAIRVWIPSSVPTTGNTGVRIAGAGTTTQDKDTDLRDQWVTLSGTFTWDGVGAVILYSLDSAITAGITIYLDGFHLVAGSTVPTTYVEGSGAPTDTPIGIISGALSSIATSGTNPPAAPGGFAAAAGTVQRVELADGTAFIDGIGNGTVGAGTFRTSVDARVTAVGGKTQAGTVTSGTLVAATATTVAVTFPTAFSAAPIVVPGQLGGTGAIVVDRRVTANNVTATGFDMIFWRATGTAAIDANWIAFKS